MLCLKDFGKVFEAVLQFAVALDTSLSGNGTDHSGFVTFVLMVEFWTGRAKCVFFKVLSCQHQLYAP